MDDFKYDLEYNERIPPNYGYGDEYMVGNAPVKKSIFSTIYDFISTLFKWLYDTIKKTINKLKGV